LGRAGEARRAEIVATCHVRLQVVQPDLRLCVSFSL
jgi:hypothetical protein